MPKPYYIDFASFVILADNEDQAQKKAEEYMKQGKLPTVCGIEEADNEDGNRYTQDELGD